MATFRIFQDPLLAWIALQGSSQTQRTPHFALNVIPELIQTSLDQVVVFLVLMVHFLGLSQDLYRIAIVNWDIMVHHFWAKIAFCALWVHFVLKIQVVHRSLQESIGSHLLL
jgi:hypothetical protein